MLRSDSKEDKIFKSKYVILSISISTTKYNNSNY